MKKMIIRSLASISLALTGGDCVIHAASDSHKILIPQELDVEVTIPPQEVLLTDSPFLDLRFSAQRQKLIYSSEVKEFIYSDSQCSTASEKTLDPRWLAFEATAEEGEKTSLLQTLLLEKISFSEAHLILSKGFFRTRPAGWMSFKEEIRRIDREVKGSLTHALLADSSAALVLRASLGVVEMACETARVTERLPVLHFVRAEELGSQSLSLRIRFEVAPDLFSKKDLQEGFLVQWAGETPLVVPHSGNRLIYETKRNSKNSPPEIVIRAKGLRILVSDAKQVEASLLRDFRQKTLRLKVERAQKAEASWKLEYQIFRFRPLAAEDLQVAEGEARPSENKWELDLKEVVQKSPIEKWKPGSSYYAKIRYRQGAEEEIYEASPWITLERQPSPE